MDARTRLSVTLYVNCLYCHLIHSLIQARSKQYRRKQLNQADIQQTGQKTVINGRRSDSNKGGGEVQFVLQRRPFERKVV